MKMILQNWFDSLAKKWLDSRGKYEYRALDGMEEWRWVPNVKDRFFNISSWKGWTVDSQYLDMRSVEESKTTIKMYLYSWNYFKNKEDAELGAQVVAKALEKFHREVLKY